MKVEIDLRAISKGYDRKTCWVHPRPGVIPGKPETIVVTMQKLRLTGMDVFYPLNEMRSDDGGETWSSPVEHADSLGRRQIEPGLEEATCDFWPAWHAKTGLLLGTGHTVWYAGDNIPRTLRSRH